MTRDEAQHLPRSGPNGIVTALRIAAAALALAAAPALAAGAHADGDAMRVDWLGAGDSRGLGHA